MNKLNFGCGSIQPEGWINVDKDPSFNTWTRNTSELGTDSFDIIVAHAVLQQTEWHEMVDQLKELHRILKPGGLFRISLPDIITGFWALADGNRDWFVNRDEETIDLAFSAWITWYSTSKTLLTHDALAILLGKAGFTNMTQTAFGMSRVDGAADLDTRRGEFFFMEAFK